MSRTDRRQKWGQSFLSSIDAITLSCVNVLYLKRYALGNILPLKRDSPRVLAGSRKFGIAIQVLNEMIRKSYALAPLVLGGFLLAFAPALPAQAAGKQTHGQVTNDKECTQAIADTKESRAGNPELGPKAAKAFDEILALAEKRCEQKEYPFAAELFNIARGMVASE